MNTFLNLQNQKAVDLLSYRSNLADLKRMPLLNRINLRGNIEEWYAGRKFTPESVKRSHKNCYQKTGRI